MVSSVEQFSHWAHGNEYNKLCSSLCRMQESTTLLFDHREALDIQSAWCT